MSRMNPENDGLLADRHGDDRQLDRDQPPVAMEGLDLDPRVQDASPRRSRASGGVLRCGRRDVRAGRSSPRASRPITSSALQPNVVSACGFQPMITPSTSMLTTASRAESTISRRCSWASWSRRSASLRAVMSSWNPCQYGDSILGSDERRLVEDPDDAAVLPDHAVLEGEPVRAVRVARCVGREDQLPIVRVDHGSPQIGIGDHPIDGDAGQLLGAGSDVLRERPRRIVGIDGLDVEDRRVLLDHRAERELRLSEALLGIVARAHIGQEAEEVVELPVLVQDRRRGVVHPHPMTVRVTHPILVLERLEVGVVERVDLAETREVVGMHELEPQVGPLQEPFGLIPEDAPPSAGSRSPSP